VILLDAYAIIALLAAEPAGPPVRSLLESEQCAVSVLNLSEAADVLQRTRGVDVARTRGIVAGLMPRPLAVLDVDERRGWRAAEIRARHYRRRGTEISLADCVLLATAVPGRDSIATSDRPVARIATSEGIEILALPDRRRRRPL
jgi:predicted nucleic acid-binding protein